MSGWTKGPLVVHEKVYDNQPIVIGRKDAGPRYTLAKVINIPGHASETLANAHLYAAAPDLAEAVEAASLAIGDWSRPTSANGMTMPSPNHPLLVAAEKLRAALLKAKGE